MIRAIWYQPPWGKEITKKDDRDLKALIQAIDDVKHNGTERPLNPQEIEILNFSIAVFKSCLES